MGVIELEVELAGLDALRLVATTENVYVVPFVSPDTVIGEAVPVAVSPPGEEVTVYVALIAPPRLVEGVNLTDASPLLPLAITLVGVLGATAVTGIMALDGELSNPDPIELVALTVNV